MSRTAVFIGPQDHGKAMSLADFEHAQPKEGHVYELGRGVIIVSDVPNKKHLAQVNALRRLLSKYDLEHPGVIHTLASGSECKILLRDAESERHPDLAIYKTAPPEGDDIWDQWIPEIVIEVVSESSRQRDCDEKPKEYYDFGVMEYWIFDEPEDRATFLRRAGGRWSKIVKRPGEAYETRRLAGLVIDPKPVFDAAR